MPETNVPETQVVAPVTTPASPEGAQPEAETWTDGTPFDAKRAKELVAKLDAEAKEGKKAVKRLAELEAKELERANAELSELDKAKKEIEALNNKVTAQARRELQAKVADKVGLPVAFASRIQGENEEDMEEDAKSLLEAMPAKVPPKTPPTNPGNPQFAGETPSEKRVRLMG